MKARPIILNAHEVKAVLEGRKTQHRIVMTPQPKLSDSGNYEWNFKSKGFLGAGGSYIENFPPIAKNYCRHGGIGDILWIKEAFTEHDNQPIYRASNQHLEGAVRWRITPRWASRLTLEITDVRVERLQDISEEDAIAEGCRPFFDKDCPVFMERPNGNKIETYPHRDALYSFSQLWDSINKKRGFGWDENPWVWVIEFKTHLVNVDKFMGE